MKVKMEEKNSIEPGNPYLSDFYHMGMTFGKDITLMYPHHPHEECKYFIIVNTRTGERVKIIIEEI